MDKDFLVGAVCFLVGVLGLAGIIAGSALANQALQIEELRVCVNSHHTLQYREVNGKTVSECK